MLLSELAPATIWLVLRMLYMQAMSINRRSVCMRYQQYIKRQPGSKRNPDKIANVLRTFAKECTSLLPNKDPVLMNQCSIAVFVGSGAEDLFYVAVRGISTRVYAPSVAGTAMCDSLSILSAVSLGSDYEHRRPVAFQIPDLPPEDEMAVHIAESNLDGDDYIQHETATEEECMDLIERVVLSPKTGTAKEEAERICASLVGHGLSQDVFVGVQRGSGDGVSVWRYTHCFHVDGHFAYTTFSLTNETVVSVGWIVA